MFQWVRAQLAQSSLRRRATVLQTLAEAEQDIGRMRATRDPKWLRAADKLERQVTKSRAKLLLRERDSGVSAR